MWDANDYIESIKLQCLAFLSLSRRPLTDNTLLRPSKKTCVRESDVGGVSVFFHLGWRVSTVIEERGRQIGLDRERLCFKVKRVCSWWITFVLLWVGSSFWRSDLTWLSPTAPHHSGCSRQIWKSCNRNQEKSPCCRDKHEHTMSFFSSSGSIK